MAVFELDAHKFIENQWVPFKLILTDPNTLQDGEDFEGIVGFGTSAFYYQKIQAGSNAEGKPEYLWARARLNPKKDKLEWYALNLKQKHPIWFMHTDKLTVDEAEIVRKLLAAEKYPIPQEKEEDEEYSSTTLDLESQTYIKSALSHIFKKPDTLSEPDWQMLLRVSLSPSHYEAERKRIYANPELVSHYKPLLTCFNTANFKQYLSRSSRTILPTFGEVHDYIAGLIQNEIKDRKGIVIDKLPEDQATRIIIRNNPKEASSFRGLTPAQERLLSLMLLTFSKRWNRETLIRSFRPKDYQDFILLFNENLSAEQEEIWNDFVLHAWSETENYQHFSQRVHVFKRYNPPDHLYMLLNRWLLSPEGSTRIVYEYVNRFAGPEEDFLIPALENMTEDELKIVFNSTESPKRLDCAFARALNAKNKKLIQALVKIDPSLKSRRIDLNLLFDRETANSTLFNAPMPLDKWGILQLITNQDQFLMFCEALMEPGWQDILRRNLTLSPHTVIYTLLTLPENTRETYYGRFKHIFSLNNEVPNIPSMTDPALLKTLTDIMKNLKAEQIKPVATLLKHSFTQVVKRPVVMNELLKNIQFRKERIHVLTSLWSLDLEDSYVKAIINPNDFSNMFMETLELLDPSNRNDFITFLGIEKLAKMFDYNLNALAVPRVTLNQQQQQQLDKICKTALEQRKSFEQQIEDLQPEQAPPVVNTPFLNTDIYCNFIVISHAHRFGSLPWHKAYIAKSDIKNLSPKMVKYQMKENLDPRHFTALTEFYGEPLKELLRPNPGTIDDLSYKFTDESSKMDFLFSVYSPDNLAKMFSEYKATILSIQPENKLKLLKKLEPLFQQSIRTNPGGYDLITFVYDVFNDHFYPAINTVGPEAFIKFMDSCRTRERIENRYLTRAYQYYNGPQRYHRPPEQPLNQFIQEFLGKVVGLRKFAYFHFNTRGDEILQDVISACRDQKSPKEIMALCEKKLEEINRDEQDPDATFSIRTKPKYNGETAMRLMFCLDLLNNEINPRPSASSRVSLNS